MVIETLKLPHNFRKGTVVAAGGIVEAEVLVDLEEALLDEGFAEGFAEGDGTENALACDAGELVGGRGESANGLVGIGFVLQGDHGPEEID